MRKFHILLLFCFFVKTSPAQETVLSIERYGVEQGLSHRQVNAIVQDVEGFIWLATEDGLNRFDGHEFKWWTKEENGLSQNNINHLTEDADGYLWLFYQYSHRKNRFYHVNQIDLLHPQTREVISFADRFGTDLPFELKDVYANCRVKGPDSTLFLGTSNGARLIAYHPRNGFQVRTIEGYDSFFPLALTGEGDVWGLVGRKILLKIDSKGNVLKKLQYEEKLNHSYIIYDGHYLWLQITSKTQPTKFQKVDGQTGEVIKLSRDELKLPEKYADIGYHRMRYDPAHEVIWGFNLFNYVAHIPTNTKSPDIDISHLLPEFVVKGEFGFRGFYVDKEARVWLGGGFGFCVLSISKNRFNNYLYHDEDEEVQKFLGCRGILKTKEYLFVGTDKSNNGLNKVHLKSQQHEAITASKLMTYSSDGHISANAVASWDEKSIWAAKHHLFKINLENGELAYYKEAQRGDIPLMWSLFKNDQDRIWIGTASGLAYFDLQKEMFQSYSKYNDFEGISNAVVIGFVEDKNDLIWLCTNKGLFSWNMEKGITGRFWTGGDDAFYLPHDDIRHLYIDAEGVYWIATGGGGLIKWDKGNGTYEQFTRTDGLANNSLYGIYEDQRQHLWISSDFGIIQFDKNSNHSRVYLKQDGITHNEFNRTSHHQDENGHIYFGGINGVTSFDPVDFYENKTKKDAPLVITDFQQFKASENKLVDIRDDYLANNEIVIEPKDRFFNLSFALLNFQKPELVRYAYQIEGWDSDWQYQRENSIRFGQLPYGQHLLKIKAQAADGHWSKNELNIPIKVVRPIYLQWWFLFILGLAIAVLATWLYRFFLNRKLEKQEAQQLKELDQVKTSFYANITHEFRTPLTVIIGVAENIQGYFSERQLIQRNSKTLLQLVNQLLDLSKLEAGSMTLETEQANIIPYLNYLTASFNSAAKEKDITLTFQSELEELVMDFDEVKIQQILYNLLSNALKFTSPGGQVSVIAVETYLDHSTHLMIKVKDTGIGIAPKELPHIFDRFYQVNGSTHHKGEGTGIGLSLMQELVKLMQGRVAVESEIGEGTTFLVYIPVTNIAHEKEEHRDAIPTELMGENLISNHQISIPQSNGRLSELPRLLIIEDNADVTFYIHSCVQSHYQVSTAQDGKEGINKALSEIPDLIISDVMMPEADGYEVCKTLKKDERTSHVPIVLLTAKAAQEDKLDGLQKGADAYLTKPFDKRELLVRLKNLLELRKKLQRKYQAASPPPVIQEQPPSPDDLFFQKISQVIKENLDNPDLSVHLLAKSTLLGRTQVYRKIKALTGKTPTRLIRSFRMQKAKDLLENTQLNVSEVAYEVGFSDPNYFSRVFHSEYEAWPSTFK